MPKPLTSKLISQNSYLTLYNFLEALNIPVTQDYLKEELATEAYPQSLEALKGVLETLRFNTLSVQISASQLKEVHLPAIAHLREEDEYFIVLLSADTHKVKYIDSRRGILGEEIIVFQKKWTGAVLMALPSEKSGQANYKSEAQKTFIKRYRYPFVLGILVGLIIWGVLMSNNMSLSIYLLLSLKLLGIVLSILLLQEDIGQSSTWVQQMCSFAKNTSCNAVLRSKMAGFGGISMSDLGFLYFSFGFLSIFFDVLGNTGIVSLQVLLWLNFLTLPYTFFSVYYQGRVIKQWCVLCLGVQGLFWLEFLVLTPYISSLFTDMSHIEIYTSCWAFAIPFLLLMTYKELFIKTLQFKRLFRTLKALRKNATLFWALLEKQYKIHPPELQESIVLGNQDAPICLTLIASVFCNPCHQAKQNILKLMNDYPELVKLHLVLMGNEQGDKRQEINEYLYQIYDINGEATFIEALDNWYVHQHLDKLQQQFPLQTKIPEGITAFALKQESYIAQYHIKSTPSIFINEYQLPYIYQIQHLKYHLSAIAEQTSK